MSGEAPGGDGSRPPSAISSDRSEPGAAGALEIIQPEGWQAPKGYANAVAGRGRLVFVAGQVGWDPLTGTFAGDDLAAQAAQALANVAAVLRAAGAEPGHVVRMTWYVTNREEYLAARPAIGAAYRAVMGRHYPAMSLLIVHSLLEERAKVEIEATALIPDLGYRNPGVQRRRTTVNAFAKKHGVPPETITLASGAVHVQKFSWRFRLWAGEPIGETYGGKAIVDSEGSPVFAELAMIHVLEEHGFDGAVWVDSYRGRFRNAMAPAVCTLPAHALQVYDRIVTINGGRRGCWDVLAWSAVDVAFVECKRKGQDHINSNQVKWLESALRAGLRLEDFAICEWEIE